MKSPTLVVVVLATILISVMAGCGPSSVQATETPEEVARRELPIWLQGIHTSYGIQSDQEVATATLGTPFEVRTLLPGAITSYRPGQALKNTFQQDTYLEFPIVVNGEGRGLLTVAQRGGRWEVVGLGKQALARDLVEFQKQKGNTNEPFQLVRVDSMFGNFVLEGDQGKEVLIPMTRVRGLDEAPELYLRKPQPARDLIPKLAKALAGLENAEIHRN